MDGEGRKGRKVGMGRKKSQEGERKKGKMPRKVEGWWKGGIKQQWRPDSFLQNCALSG